MTEEINELLRKICWKLSDGDVANFVADAKMFHSNQTSDFDEINSIKNILGENIVEVGGIEKTNLDELLETVKDCFEYYGDEGSYPNKNYQFSEEFKLDISQTLKKIESLFSESSKIFTFWLKEGHPFYPVYWDFAFLVRKRNGDFVFIGSSSD